MEDVPSSDNQSMKLLGLCQCHQCQSLELLGYTMSIGESVSSILDILEGNKLSEEGGNILYGDNQSDLRLLESPDGPWRMRHLRRRSFVLRERLVERPTRPWCSIGFGSFDEGCDVNAFMEEVLQLHGHVRPE